MARPPYDPDDRKVKLLARLHTEAAVKKLALWLESDNPKASVAAACALLDRAWGKPKQIVEGKMEVEHKVNVGASDTFASKIERALQSRQSPTLQ